MEKWFISRVTLLCLTMIVLAGCGSSNNSTNPTPFLPNNESKITISQGACGNVWFWEGDFMPPSTGKITPVVREIHIHRVTTLTDMNVTDSFDPLFSNIPTELIATTTSDETGFYQIDLPPGIYSVFIKEGTKFYANGYDSQGRIKTLEVLPGTVTKLQLDITYTATF